MTRIATCAAALAAFGFAAGAEDYNVGMMPVAFDGERGLAGHVVYPTREAAETSDLGGNPVWMPVQVQEGAEIAEGTLPLVVLSHGMYGNRFNQTWLAERLAQAGFVSVAIDHPGTSTWSRDPALSRQMWERPMDVSRVIEGMFADPEWSGVLDSDAVFAIGHSLGGLTVLANAGGIMEADRLAEYCGGADLAPICDPLMRLGINAEDREELALDVSDDRIRAVVSLDPGGTQLFTDESLGAIDTAVLLIAADRTPEQVDRALESDRVAELVPSGAITYMPVEAAGHFDFVGQCTENALAILQEEEPEDVYVCARGTDARAALHEAFSAEIIAFLSAQMGE